MRVLLVGGAVRDQMLGVSSKDLDFCVELTDMIGQPAEDGFAVLRSIVENDGFEIFKEDPAHVTLRAKSLKGHRPTILAHPQLIEGQTVDFVLCRKDGPSSDGRHPDFVQVADLASDQARRDLTINSMARAEDGTLIDPHHGREDLEAGLIRFVGNPEDRLAEDALRAFRALRFAVTKRFTLAPETVVALQALHAEAFDAVSTDRICNDELHKMFSADTAASIVLLTSFPIMLEVALARGIRLLPTMKEKK